VFNAASPKKTPLLQAGAHSETPMDGSWRIRKAEKPKTRRPLQFASEAQQSFLLL